MLLNEGIPMSFIAGGFAGGTIGGIIGVSEAACLAILADQYISNDILIGGYFAGTTTGFIAGITGAAAYSQIIKC